MPAPHHPVALGHQLSTAANVVREATAAALAPLALVPREYGVLATLGAEGAMSQRALGARGRIDRTTMVAIVDRLEEGGLVTREADPEDRRAHVVGLTARGRTVLARAQRLVTEVEARLLAPVRAADRAALRRALAALVEAAPAPE